MTFTWNRLPKKTTGLGDLIDELNARLPLLAASLLQPESQYDLRYGTTVTVDVSQKQIAKPRINVTNGSPFTVANPVGSQIGGLLILQFVNTTGGGMGAITFGSAYILDSSFTGPGGGNRGFIVFECIDTHPAASWAEVCRKGSGVGSGGPPSGSAGGVLSGSYPNPGFASDMATQAELDAAIAAHLVASDPHPQYATDADLLLYAKLTDLARYQPLADTRYDLVTSDRAGTWGYVEERVGVREMTDTRAGIR